MGVSRWRSAFLTKLFNQTLESPHWDNKIDKDKSPTCPLCHHGKCDAGHILMECTDVELTRIREQLDEDIHGILTPKRRPYWDTDIHCPSIQ